MISGMLCCFGKRVFNRDTNQELTENTRLLNSIDQKPCKTLFNNKTLQPHLHNTIISYSSIHSVKKEFDTNGSFIGIKYNNLFSKENSVYKIRNLETNKKTEINIENVSHITLNEDGQLALVIDNKIYISKTPVLDSIKINQLNDFFCYNDLDINYSISISNFKLNNNNLIFICRETGRSIKTKLVILNLQCEIKQLIGLRDNRSDHSGGEFLNENKFIYNSSVNLHILDLNRYENKIINPEQKIESVGIGKYQNKIQSSAVFDNSLLAAIGVYQSEDQSQDQTQIKLFTPNGHNDFDESILINNIKVNPKLVAFLIEKNPPKNEWNKNIYPNVTIITNPKFKNYFLLGIYYNFKTSIGMFENNTLLSEYNITNVTNHPEYKQDRIHVSMVEAWYYSVGQIKLVKRIVTNFDEIVLSDDGKIFVIKAESLKFNTKVYEMPTEYSMGEKMLDNKFVDIEFI